MFSVVFLCDLIAKENQNRSKSAESLPLSLPNTPNRRGSRILKWGVNFCNNVLGPVYMEKSCPG